MNCNLTISKWSLLAVLMISYIHNHTLSPATRPMLGELYKMKHVEENLWSTNLYLMRSWRLDSLLLLLICIFLVDDVDCTASKTGSIPKGNAFKIQTALHLSKHNTKYVPVCMFIITIYSSEMNIASNTKSIYINSPRQGNYNMAYSHWEILLYSTSALG